MGSHGHRLGPKQGRQWGMATISSGDSRRDSQLSLANEALAILVCVHAAQWVRVCAGTAALSLQWKAHRNGNSAAAYGSASVPLACPLCVSLSCSASFSLWQCYRKIPSLSIFAFSSLSLYFTHSLLNVIVLPVCHFIPISFCLSCAYRSCAMQLNLLD